ncbi:MAG TPA: hypothetical protein VFG50_14225 [Rhodothermales bacterium]|nr:hypothetical protein [Rhodothermales bacterium]
MVQAVRKRVTIKRGGIVEMQDPELPEGAEAEIIILLNSQPSGQDLPPLTELVGSAKGVFKSPEEIDAYIRDLRDEWD